MSRLTHPRAVSLRREVDCDLTNRNQGHIHLAMLAGRDPLARWAKPLDTWLALFLNHRQGRHGPVIQERPKTVYMPPDRASFLVPYLHNNPVRAGRAADQSHPLWTSHSAYLGEQSPPRGLAVEVGLDLCCSSSSADGRAAFSQLVVARATEGGDEWLSPHDAEAQRSKARRDSGAPIELTSPIVSSRGMSYGIVDESRPARRLGFTVAPREVVVAACLLTGVEEALVVSRSRRRDVVATRRLAAWVWREIGRSLVEMSRILGIGSSAMSRLVDEQRTPRRPIDHQRVEVLIEYLAGRALDDSGATLDTEKR